MNQNLDTNDTTKNVFAYVNAIPSTVPESLSAYKEMYGEELRVISIRDESYRPNSKDVDAEFPSIICDFSDDESIETALAPIKDLLIGVSARREANAVAMASLLPHLPEDIRVPKPESILWSTNKQEMREHIHNVNPAVVPRFTFVTADFEETIQKATNEVGFPLMIKPTGLFSSLLITDCEDEAELRSKLRVVLDKLNETYEKAQRKDTPAVIIEQKLLGDLYSIDSYVDNDGNTYHLPICSYKSGHEMGINDYFVYRRDTPVEVSDDDESAAQQAIDDAIAGLELRNSTTHGELIKTEEGWKIIEIGPRIGRFRHEMYKRSFGINHCLNDLLIHLPNRQPIVLSKAIGHTAAFTFFADQEGEITSIEGLDDVRALESFKSLKEGVKVGEQAKFSRNGGTMVIEVVLSNENYDQFSADISALESSVKIRV